MGTANETKTVRETERKYESAQPVGPELIGELAAATGGAAPPAPDRADLSATVFLEEPGAYDGGELIVEGAFGEAERRRSAPSTMLRMVPLPPLRAGRICSARTLTPSSD